MSDQQTQIEQDIQNYKSSIKFREALTRLERNKDFITVISEGYQKKEAVRLVNLRVDPNTQSDHSQRSILRDIDAIAALGSYLQHIHQQADIALKSLETSEQTLEAVLAEEQE